MLIQLCYKYPISLAYDQFINTRKAQCTERRSRHRLGLCSSALGLRTNHWHLSFIHWSPPSNEATANSVLNALTFLCPCPLSTKWYFTHFFKSTCRFLPAIVKAALHTHSLSVVCSTFQNLLQKPKTVHQICM